MANPEIDNYLNDKRRYLGEKYYIEEGKLFKSNGVEVPLDEPVFLLRAKDICAVPTLLDYKDYCAKNGVNKEQIEQLYDIISDFAKWAAKNKDKMKLPNSTKGL